MFSRGWKQCFINEMASLHITALGLQHKCEAVHACQRVWMLLPKHLSHLHHVHLQLFGLLSPPLIPKRRRQVNHAGQRV